MKQRMTTLLLTAALSLSLLGATVLAAEGESAGSADPAAAPALPQSAEEKEAPRGEETGGETEAAAPEEESAGETLEEYIPDQSGSITFTNLERRMREGNLSLLALEESIQAIESIDYDKMRDELRDGLNGIAMAQSQMMSMGGMVQIPPITPPAGMESLFGEINQTIGGINQAVSASMSMTGSMASQSMQGQYDSLRKSFDDLKEGKLQQDNADLVWQLRSAQNQVVMAGEGLYLTLLDLELNDQSLERSLEALDRSLEELELRYQLGHISSQTLRQAQAGRTSLVSGRQTLEMNISNLKMQLELLAGAELTGDIRLGKLPQVTNAQLSEMDLEADLAAAKEASYSLRDAKLTLDDAEEAYKDSIKKYGTYEKNYHYQMAQHQRQAAQYNYEAAVRSYEMSFRTLYAQVKDYKQVLDAARTALAVEQNNLAVDQLKYDQGKISRNALSDAQDKVASAQQTADGAAIDLFTAYHNYRWAVEHGILN